MRSARVHLRLTEREKEDWGETARRDGFFHNGEPNISGWLRQLAQERVAAKPRRRR